MQTNPKLWLLKTFVVNNWQRYTGEQKKVSTPLKYL